LEDSARQHEFELMKKLSNIQQRYTTKVAAKTNQPIAVYNPFLGRGQAIRVCQFIFRPILWNDVTDEGESE